MTVDLVIRSGTVMTPHGRLEGGVAVEKLIQVNHGHSKSKITRFEGTKGTGLPVCTIVRGRVVMRDGELVGEPGWGKPVVPATAVAA